MSNTRNGKGLKGKELITIGIFSAIYFVINFAFMLMGGIHPMLWILMPGFIAVFAGIPFMLMAAKVQKPGAVFLMGLITAFSGDELKKSRKNSVSGWDCEALQILC